MQYNRTRAPFQTSMPQYSLHALALDMTKLIGTFCDLRDRV